MAAYGATDDKHKEIADKRLKIADKLKKIADKRLKIADKLPKIADKPKSLSATAYTILQRDSFLMRINYF
ncbi:hypothetical protein [Metaplanococcus flavidus]|uniref:Uncharacterized protein n=1 Tax=Metaplanococcus flavidus TaxID=569883 RepID=A0ABW3LF47_9BACL